MYANTVHQKNLQCKGEIVCDRRPSGRFCRAKCQGGTFHSTHEERQETNQCIFLSVEMEIEVTR